MRSNKALVVAALVGVSGALAAPAAFAQGRSDTGFYAGGSFGQATTDIECVGADSCDDKDTSFKFFGGYQFSRNIAIEFGYADLGEQSASFSGFGGITTEASAWDLVGVGIFPINNQFSVYGKLGFYRAEVEVSGLAGSGKKTTTDLTYGAGVRYNFTPNLGVRAEWQRYSGLESPGVSAISGGFEFATGGDSDVDVLSVGIVYKF